MSPQDNAAFLTWVQQQIPLTRALAINHFEFDGERLVMGLPLAPNHNDKGTAFGGSLATLATLAGWAYVMLVSQDHGIPVDVVIADSHLRYKAPVTGDFKAIVEASDESRQALLDNLRSRGKGKLPLSIKVSADEADAPVAMEHDGLYVARQLT